MSFNLIYHKLILYYYFKSFLSYAIIEQKEVPESYGS